MLGAIVGDIVGSVYERNNIKTKKFPLFRDDCHFTDDTVMTCAVAEAVMNGGQKDDFIDAIKKYGRAYPNVGYGSGFRKWIKSDDREPYYSCGNGAAMRVSPCAWMMDCGFMDRTGVWPSAGSACAELSAAVTHNHPEGIKGAMATADAIFLCRYYFHGYGDNGEISYKNNPEECKKLIRNHIEWAYGYDLSKTLDEIRPTYGLMRLARAVCLRPSSHFWKAQTLKMPFEMPFLLEATAILLLQSQAASQRRLTGFPTGSNAKHLTIWMRH